MGKCVECTGECPGEVKSDKCIKYTGPDFPLLNIHTGDSLACVEASLFVFLTNIKEGVNLNIDLSDVTLCKIITDNIDVCAECTGISLTDIIKALIRSVCAIQVSVEGVNSNFAALEDSYTIGCLTGVTGEEGTHTLLQTTINKLCSVNQALAALTLNVTTNYVKDVDIDAYIEAYITASPINGKMYSKMIPFSALPYFGPRNNFDSSGAGMGVWEKIYLCNGANNTPDIRGNTLVGANTMGTNAYTNNNTNPAAPFNNPSYDVRTSIGANKITLNLSQMPSHGHAASAVSIDSGHNHTFRGVGSDGSATGNDVNHPDGPTSTQNTSTSSANITTTVTVAPIGDGLPHDNIQPSLGCYYIIYIP